MYARGSPRVYAARADLTLARKYSRTKKERKREREREREKMRKVETPRSLNFELSRGFIAEGGPIVEIKGPRKS